MVRLHRSAYDRVGGVDQQRRVGRWGIVGEVESDGAGEVLGELIGSRPANHRFVTPRRTGDVAKGTGGDRFDRVDRRRRAVVE